MKTYPVPRCDGSDPLTTQEVVNLGLLLQGELSDLLIVRRLTRTGCERCDGSVLASLLIAITAMAKAANLTDSVAWHMEQASELMRAQSMKGEPASKAIVDELLRAARGER